MRIVLDTTSKSWRTFVRILIGVILLLLGLVVFAVIESISGFDLSFQAGYFAAAFTLIYKWRPVD